MKNNNYLRVLEHPVLGAVKVKSIHFNFNGRQIAAMEGDTIASALMANDIKNFRQVNPQAQNRGIYCNIGHCFECRVQIENDVTVRACLTKVYDGMQVSSIIQNK